MKSIPQIIKRIKEIDAMTFKGLDSVQFMNLATERQNLYKDYFNQSIRAKLRAIDNQMTANYEGVEITLHYELDKGFKSNDRDVPDDPTDVVPISLHIGEVDVTDIFSPEKFETISEHIIHECYE